MTNSVSNSSVPTTDAKVMRSVKNAVNEIGLLQKTIDNQSSDNRQTIAVALIRQKRALSKLRDLAGNGSALAGAAYIKGCCISGQEVDYIFNFRDNYIDSENADYLNALFEPQHLIPFLHEQNVLSKVQSITSFVIELPDLTAASFHPDTFDALHTPNQAGYTFNQQLSDKLKQSYTAAITPTGIDHFEMNGVMQAIQLTAQKGYPAVQNLYASILTQTNKETANDMWHTILRNKYASPADVKQANIRLKTDKTHILHHTAQAHQMVG